MPTFILSGTLDYAGKVRLTAPTREEAISRAEAGEFDEVVETYKKEIRFVFDGDPDSIEEAEVMTADAGKQRVRQSLPGYRLRQVGERVKAGDYLQIHKTFHLVDGTAWVGQVIDNVGAFSSIWTDER